MDRFGKYEIVEKIGEGGFGVIYKGFDPLIKRTVAIKTCTSEDKEIRDRFFQEAEIAGNLQHRNITIVYDFGVHGDVPYLVQEYLGGEDLDRKIKRRDAMSFGTKLLYLVQVARGLEYAHSRGVIHRDIKPSNIRILADDTVKIMDFGIAKLAHAGSTSLTQTGQTIGTAAYLAPEQIRGEEVDQRADIFAFGLLTYEILTGQRAFSGDNPSSVIYKVLTEEPTPVADYVPDCPSEMLAVLARCLQKAPDDRYLSCGALLADLDHLIEFKRDETVNPAPGFRPAANEPSPISASAPTLRSSPHATQQSAAHHTLRSDGPRAASVRSSPHSTLEVADASSLDHIRLRPDSTRSAPVPLATSGAAKTKRGAGIIGYLLLFLLLGGLGAGAWWYWERYLPTQQEQVEIAGSDGKPAGGATAGGGAESGSEEESGTEEGVGDEPDTSSEEEGSRADSDATTDGTSGGTTATDAKAETEEPPPPPPPPRGTLVLPQAWDPAMTVSINDGRALVLDREHNLQLPPGRYRLVFDLIGRDYDATGELTVTLGEGQSREARIPIPRPASIQVRQLPGSPRGWVMAADEPLGWSPIQERQLAPGAYDLVIKRGPTATDEVALTYPITLRPNRLLIVTFDLRRSVPPTLVERPIQR